MLFTGFKSKGRQRFFKGLILLVAVTFAGSLIYTGVRFATGGSQRAEAVARVNGERIDRPSFDKTFLGVLRAQEAMMGRVLPEEYAPIKLYVLDQLVNNALLLQTAKKEKVRVATSELDERLAKEKAYFPSEEDFKAALEAGGLSISDLKRILREQMMVEGLLARVREGVTVSDEEVKKAYKEETEKEPSGEEFEKAKAKIKERLLAEAQSKAVNDWFKKIRDEAEVEVLDLGLKAAREAQAGRFDAAISLYEQAVAQSSPTFDLYVGLGKAYEAKKDKEKALASFKKAAELAPNDPYLHVLLGNTYQERGKIDEALEEYKRASELSYSDMLLHLELHGIYQGLGKEDLAKLEEQKILDIQKMYEAMQKTPTSPEETPSEEPSKEGGGE